MKHSTRFLGLPLSALLLFVATTGCDNASTETASSDTANSQQSHDHDHDEHADEPATFAEALAKLQEMKSEICTAFENETPEDAHDALHGVGHLLEDLPKLAAQQDGLSAEQLGNVETAVESLFDGFGQLDDTLHGGEEVDLEQLDKQLTEAMASLEGAVK